jgi:hypothetical protein
MSFILPEHLRELHTRSMAQAFKVYRDELGMHVYPCYSPKADVKDPGKQPAILSYWEFDPRTCNLSRFFGAENGRCYNIGTCALTDLKFLDLDSKPDQGISVRKHVEAHPILSKLPQHQTRGGAHLAFICPDMPKWTKGNGRPYRDRLVATVSDTIRAELFHCDRNNIILPPSVHKIDNFIYTWTLLGEVPVLLWKEISALYPWIIPGQTQRPPGRPKKEPPWFHRYRGFLGSLDLVDLLHELNLRPELIDTNDCKYRITCPWEKEHSETRENDTSTVIWQPGAPHWPSFKCLHSHGPNLNLEQVLSWAEDQAPGIVDRFCAEERVWSPGQKSASGLPRILHPINELDSVVYAQIAEIVAPHHVWFIRGEQPTVISDVPSGFEYSKDEKYKITAHITGFRTLAGIEAKSGLEQFAEPGFLNKDGEFIKSSFTAEWMAGMIASSQFKTHLPRIVRILTVPLPILIEDALIYPDEGYDPRFGTYLVPSAPKLISPLPSLAEAIKIINTTFAGCRFTSDQSRVHAVARLLTPFGRGIFGWTARVPLWLYCANRPRAGKDYLNGCTMIVYDGIAHEDSPIGREEAETGKRITAALLSGRRAMHFSNCSGYLKDDKLFHAITAPAHSDRQLGSNAASADLTLHNELEFSISANIGFTARPDLEPRTRKIELAYFEEDENSRTFPNPFLHETIAKNRPLILSAIAAIYQHWALQGFPKGQTPFSSFPRWSEIIGGVMMTTGLGNPCLPFQGAFDIGHDPETVPMRALWAEAEEKFKHPEAPKKSDLYELIVSSETSALDWFGSLSTE